MFGKEGKFKPHTHFENKETKRKIQENDMMLRSVEMNPHTPTPPLGAKEQNHRPSDKCLCVCVSAINQ